MPGEQEKTRTCKKCGRTILPEQLKNHTAARYKGHLLCPDCVQELKTRLAAAQKAEEGAGGPPDPDDAPIALVGEDELSGPDGAGAELHGFSGAEMTAQRTEERYRRPLLKDSPCATRCRTFHCKMTDASFKNLNEQINEWIDASDEIEIKFAVSNIGVVEGKHADPHLVITVFY
jgi:hypothetical protein